MRHLFVAIIGAVLAGCANYGTMSPATERAAAARDYSSLSDRDLCASLDDVRRCARAPLCSAPRSEPDRIRAEIDKRKLVPAMEWPEIEAGAVRRGMGYCAVLAAWGRPIMASDAGVTTTMAFEGARAVGFMNGKAIVVTAPVSR